jgi:hypothetical protein
MERRMDGPVVRTKVDGKHCPHEYGDQPKHLFTQIDRIHQLSFNLTNKQVDPGRTCNNLIVVPFRSFLREPSKRPRRGDPSGVFGLVLYFCTDIVGGLVVGDYPRMRMRGCEVYVRRKGK